MSDFKTQKVAFFGIIWQNIGKGIEYALKIIHFAYIDLFIGLHKLSKMCDYPFIRISVTAINYSPYFTNFYFLPNFIQ